MERKRPSVRGVVMNPVDHPHGGGEGKTWGRHPVTPWGVPTKGKKQDQIRVLINILLEVDIKEGREGNYG